MQNRTPQQDLDRFVQLSQALPNLTMGELDALAAATEGLELAVVIHTPRSGPDHCIWFDRTAAMCWITTSPAGDCRMEFSSLAKAMAYYAEFIVNTQF